MTLNLFRILLCALLLLVVSQAHARDLTGVKVNPAAVLPGTDTHISIELAKGAACGVLINFGDGSTQELKIELDAGASVAHLYQQTGSYAVTVQGKTIWRGLNTTSSCDGTVASVVRVGTDTAAQTSSKSSAPPDPALAVRPTTVARGSPAVEPRLAPSGQGLNPTGRRVALVIGNGDYQHPDNLPKLDNPTNDAEDIAAALRGFGFEVIERKNQTLEGMNQTIAEFGRRIADSDAALFYFAGHGIQVKNQNFLMPINARIESEAAVPYQGVDVNRILDEMDTAKSAANIVILDACRNNPVSGKFRSGKSRGLASPGPVPKGTVIVYATDPGNVASDGDGRNGLFTAGLLTAFRGKDLSLDDVLTVASAEVERASNQAQTPYVNGPKTLQKNFQFRVTVDPGKAEVERTFWISIERSSDPADFDAYLRKYPSGSYRTLAENRLRQLRADTAPAASSPPVAKTESKVNAPPPPGRPLAADDGESAFWNEVKASGSKDYLEAYLKQYPKGKFQALARIELKKQEEREKADKAREESERRVAAERDKLAQLAAEQELWDRAKQENTELAYQRYLEQYGKGRYAALAQLGREKAQREAEERQRQMALLREQQEWDQALANQTAGGYNAYLSRYPNGRYTAQAESALQKLVQEARLREEERKQQQAQAEVKRQLELREQAAARARQEAEPRPTTAYAGVPISLKFSHVVASDTPKGKAAEFFARRATELTRGKVRVEVYASSALYKDREEMEALQLGAVQMLAPSLSKFAPLGVREFEVFDLPFLFDNAHEFHRVVQGPIGDALLGRLQAKGITGLAFWDNGFKSFSLNNPIRTPEDFRGKKIRIQSSKALDEQVRALGAVPQVMAFSEVYQALQAGVVDGTENPISNFYTQKMHEVQKHLVLTEHGYMGYAVIVNRKFWDGLPSDLRAALEQAIKEATDFANREAQQENDAALEAVRRSGRTVVHAPSREERLAFKRALAQVHKKVEIRIGSDLLQRIYQATGFDPSRL